MTTRSGRAYKMMAEVNWQEMLQGLVEDRKRRDEVIGERVQREAEIIEDRK